MCGQSCNASEWSQWDKLCTEIGRTGNIFAAYSEWDLEGCFHSSGASHEKLGTMISQKDVGRKTDRHGIREKEDVREGGERGRRRENMNENEYGAISRRQIATWAWYS